MKRNKVSLFGVLIGLVAMLLPFAAAKDNRIVEGSDLYIWEVSGSGGLLLPAGILFLLLVSALLPLGTGSPGASAHRGQVPQKPASIPQKPTFQKKARSGLLSAEYLIPVCASLILLILVILIWQTRLSVAQAEYGRVTPAAGFWVMLISLFFLFDSSFRSGKLEAWFKNSLSVLLPAALVLAALFGFFDHLAVVKEYVNRSGRFLSELYAHVGLSFTSVAAAVCIGVPLGITAWRRKKIERMVFTVVNGIQTIPSLALFGLMIVPLALLSQKFPVLREWGIKGIGNAPAIIALTLYSLLPIVRNTYTSLAMVPDSVIDAGNGLGMSKREVLRYVEIPLAVPIVLGGIRVASVITIGNTAVAALIGAGGLGNFIFQGLGQAAPDLIVLGVFPIVLLAVAVDRGFAFLISLTSPHTFKGVSES